MCNPRQGFAGAEARPGVCNSCLTGVLAAFVGCRVVRTRQRFDKALLELKDSVYITFETEAAARAAVASPPLAPGASTSRMVVLLRADYERRNQVKYTPTHDPPLAPCASTSRMLVLLRANYEWRNQVNQLPIRPYRLGPADSTSRKVIPLRAD
jgi:hypothetical protein